MAQTPHPPHAPAPAAPPMRPALHSVATAIPPRERTYTQLTPPHAPGHRVRVVPPLWPPCRSRRRARRSRAEAAVMWLKSVRHKWLE